MGFEGVVLSDSMNMKAMKRHFDPRESLVRALNAGVDLIMLAEEHYDHDANQYLANQLGLVDAVKAAIQNGTLTEDRVNEAVRRVLELKAKYGFTTDPITDQAAALSQVGGQAQRAVELNVARHAVAVLRDENGLLPLSPDTPIILVNTTDPASYRILGETRGIGPNQTTPAYHTFAEAMQAAFGDSLTTMTPAQATDSIPTNATIVAVTENYPLPGVDFDQTQQIEVVNQFATLYPDRLIVVGLRDPYETAQFSGVKCYVCAFSFRPSAAQAAADVLAGHNTAQGQTPVSIPI
jgi:beta-N-acetylhexosaminidase